MPYLLDSSVSRIVNCQTCTVPDEWAFIDLIRIFADRESMVSIKCWMIFQFQRRIYFKPLYNILMTRSLGNGAILEIFQFLERLLIEHKKPICSLDSKLFFILICSIRISSRTRDIFDKTQ